MRLVPRMALLALLAAAALPLATADARTTRTDSVSAKVQKSGRDSRGLVYRGVVHSRVFGRGSIVQHVSGLLRGTFTIRYRRGTVRGTSVAHARPRSGGGVTFTGTFRLVGGTGTYRHVRGSGRFSGKGPSDFSTATFRQRGRVSY